MTTTALHETKVEEFGDEMLAMLNHSALALMISVGHRTRLFDAMAELPPSTSVEIADAADRDERYVREWLGAMVTGGIVDYDAATRRYSLAREKAACLTRAAAPNNLAAFAQYVSVLGSVEDRIVDCFANGGGVPYSAYPRFQEVMAEDSGQSVLPELVTSIVPLVDGLLERLERGIEVLDVGCGRGRAMNLLAGRFPMSRFAGYDLSEEGIATARAESNGHANTRFEVRDATSIGETKRYDLITAFDAIHDQVRPDAVLAGIADALKDDGVFLMQDIRGSRDVEKNVDHPAGTLLYTISCMHCMTVSLAEGGAGLGAMWGEETALEMLGAAGFKHVTRHYLPHDFQNAYYVARKN